jgi:hypothetical protein
MYTPVEIHFSDACWRLLHDDTLQTPLSAETLGVERLGYRLSMSHIADGEWRAYFTRDNQKLAPAGYGVAPTPWGAVRMAARAVVGR